MQIAEFIGWLCRQPSERGGTLADRSVRNALKPVRIVLATARREGVIAHNPASEAVLPHREDVEDDDELPRPFLGDTMELVVSLIHPRHREMFELLAATGVRRSELLAFEVRHVALDGDRPHVKVRQRAAQEGHRPDGRPAEISARAKEFANPARGRRSAPPTDRWPW
jgi:integrase